jgi:hypothetical protein
MVVALLMAAMVPTEAHARVGEPPRVGLIIIVGNDGTPQDIILDNLPLYPGQFLTPVALVDANKSLRWLSLLGLGATASVVKDEASPYKEILVQVRESFLSRLLVEVPQSIRERLDHR